MSLYFQITNQPPKKKNENLMGSERRKIARLKYPLFKKKIRKTMYSFWHKIKNIKFIKKNTKKVLRRTEICKVLKIKIELPV